MLATTTELPARIDEAFYFAIYFLAVAVSHVDAPSLSAI
jgi:hypothetical protein